MLLYLLRHAEAEPDAPTDAERVLTPRGIEQAAVVRTYCQRERLQPDRILTSPYARTVQTGGIVGSAFAGVVPVQSTGFLASGMLPADAFEGLQAFAHLGALLLVGHQPDLGLLSGALLGQPEGGGLPFSTAALAGLEVERLGAGGGQLKFFVSVTQMMQPPAR